MRFHNFRTVGWVVAIFALGSNLTFADRAEDLVRIHTEAIGGKERIAALHAMRATGEVFAGPKRMRFTMIAERPDRIRLETENGDRTLVQVSDGRNPPWEFDTGDWPPRSRDMSAGAAKVFAADAEFDDPLVAGQPRGFSVEYGGEVSVDGHKALRLLVSRGLTSTFSVLLDPETYFILQRVEERKNPLGGKSTIVTEYRDYRPVDGVLVPHWVAMAIDGRVVQQTKIETIVANPEITDDTFSRPRGRGGEGR